jgi:NAD(P)-dependent dehydrogenase (short-subunit alcohol dehydrogenase family)
MSLKDKTIVVTGGSRGLGLGLVEALVDQGAKVTVVARDQAALAAVKQRLDVAVIPADVTDEGAAQRILAEVRPDILALNAGAKPRMGRLDQLSWADFTATWETDVKAGLYWMQAALNLPLKPGSRVLVGSSGAAENGSPLSGGYAGAKRMLWFMAKYANGVAEQKGLGIRFQAIVPLQMIGGTGVGDEGASAYARAMGIEPEAFLARYGAPMPPRQFGDHLVAVLDDPQYATGFAFGLKGDTGITVLERERRLERRPILAAHGAPRARKPLAYLFPQLHDVGELVPPSALIVGLCLSLSTPRSGLERLA